MSTTAPEFWGARAAEYDSLIRRTVPRYEELTERLVELVPPSVGSVLELGCGTGNLSLRLARQLPHARFTFVDASAEMTELTQMRLATSFPDVARRARFLVATFEALAPEPDAYDAAVAMISLHHVPDLAPVYATIARSLRQGGRLISADGVGAADESLQAAHVARWHAYWRQPGNLDEDEQVAVADHVARHDTYVPLTTHFEWLRAAGFRNPDCTWRDGLFALLVAHR